MFPKLIPDSFLTEKKTSLLPSEMQLMTKRTIAKTLQTRRTIYKYQDRRKVRKAGKVC
jgi:hypothetical protein